MKQFISELKLNLHHFVPVMSDRQTTSPEEGDRIARIIFYFETPGVPPFEKSERNALERQTDRTMEFQDKLKAFLKGKGVLDHFVMSLVPVGNGSLFKHPVKLHLIPGTTDARDFLGVFAEALENAGINKVATREESDSLAKEDVRKAEQQG